MHKRVISLDESLSLALVIVLILILSHDMTMTQLTRSMPSAKNAMTANGIGISKFTLTFIVYAWTVRPQFEPMPRLCEVYGVYQRD